MVPCTYYAPHDQYNIISWCIGYMMGHVLQDVCVCVWCMVCMVCMVLYCMYGNKWYVIWGDGSKVGGSCNSCKMITWLLGEALDTWSYIITSMLHVIGMFTWLCGWNALICNCRTAGHRFNPHVVLFWIMCVYIRVYNWANVCHYTVHHGDTWCTRHESILNIQSVL
jgi:hypothetical protein